MGAVARIISIVLIPLSIAALLLAVFMVRRETRIRPRLELVRFLLSAATAIVLTLVHGAETPPVYLVLGLAAGLGIGVFQGRQLMIRVADGAAFASRSVLGIVGWGAGITLMQLAGALNRSGLIPLGTAGSFFGAALLGGLMLGRSNALGAAQARTTVYAVLALGLLLSLPGTATAETVDQAPVGATVHDLSDLFTDAGKVDGLTVELRGNGSYYGSSIRVRTTNSTAETIYIRVPIGLQLTPGDTSVQTMITAGGEVIAVRPETPEGEVQTDVIIAFCGEKNDGVPGSGEVFTPGGMADPQVVRTAENINERGEWDISAVNAMWGATDGIDLSNDPLAQQLLAGESGLPPSAAVRLSVAGLVGEALLLATALANAGMSVERILGAWQDGSWSGLRDLISESAPMQPSGSGTPQDFFDPDELLQSDAVREALNDLPHGDAIAVTQELVDRLNDRLLDSATDQVRNVIGPIGPDADLDRLLDPSANPDLQDLINRLPEHLTDPRTGERIDPLIHIHNVLEAERVEVAEEMAWTIFRGEGVVIKFQDALEQSRLQGGDPGPVDKFWEGLSDAERDYLDERFPPGGDGGPTSGGGRPDALDPERVVTADDPGAVLIETPQLRDYLDSLDHETRAAVEASLLDRMNGRVIEAATDRVRDIVGPLGPGDEIDVLLDPSRNPDLQELLDQLPHRLTDPNTGDQIDPLEQIRNTLEAERLQGAGDTGWTIFENEGLVVRLQEAMDQSTQQGGNPGPINDFWDGLDDETRDAFEQHLGPEAGPNTPLDPSDIDAERVVTSTDPRTTLAENPRVRDYLDSLDPDTRAAVEADILERMNTRVLDAATDQVREVVGPLQPGSDVDALLDPSSNPDIQELLDKLPPNLTDPRTGQPIDTLTHIRNTLETERLQGATSAVDHQVGLEQARGQLEAAVRDGRAADAQRILQSLSPEDANRLSESITPSAPSPPAEPLSPTVKPGTTPPPPPPPPPSPPSGQTMQGPPQQGSSPGPAPGIADPGEAASTDSGSGKE